MISDFKQLEELFKEIDQHLTKTVRLYCIGGIVLLYHGMKPATKDIDLLLTDKDEFTAFEQALKTIHFESKKLSGVYKKMDISQILVRDDFRIDMFHRIVCKKLSLSKRMEKRAKKLLSLNHLDVYFCANEDIFVFKTLTEREGDLDDCISLAQRGLDWNIILEEIQTQIQHSGQDIWITWIGERLDILEDKGINIPIMKEVNKLRDEYFEQLEKELLNKDTNQKN